MFLKQIAALAVATALTVSAAQAATIVNLDGGPTSPNAGHNSGPYAYNPKTVSLGAGTYNVSLSSIAAGGTYDAYSVATPAANNYTDINWSVSLDGTTAAFTQGNLGRFATAALANTAYSASAGYTFTLAAAQNISLYLDDTAAVYFADDTGGVSLAINAVPEPVTMSLLLVGAVGAVAARRRAKAVASI